MLKFKLLGMVNRQLNENRKLTVDKLEFVITAFVFDDYEKGIVKERTFFISFTKEDSITDLEDFLFLFDDKLIAYVNFTSEDKVFNKKVSEIRKGENFAFLNYVNIYTYKSMYNTRHFINANKNSLQNIKYQWKFFKYGLKKIWRRMKG